MAGGRLAHLVHGIGHLRQGFPHSA
jgi:hypothetical protein